MLPPQIEPKSVYKVKESKSVPVAIGSQRVPHELGSSVHAIIRCSKWRMRSGYCVAVCERNILLVPSLHLVVYYS